MDIIFTITGFIFGAAIAQLFIHVKASRPYVGIFAVVLLFGIIAYASIDQGYSTKDKKANVVCGLGFFYDFSGGPPTSKTVDELEELAKEECTGHTYERKTPHWRWDKGHANEGKLKHAVYLPIDKMCIINWEITPNIHEKAFLDVCVNQNP